MARGPTCFRISFATLRKVTERIAFAEAVERGVLDARYPNRHLDTNVDIYKDLVLDGVGLPCGLFTPAFAIGCVLGWCGHIREQEVSGRLIRPVSGYVGALPEGTTELRMAG